MKELILNILSSAVYAPSGDNSQPWRFECKDNTIKIFNLPKNDNEIFNFKQRGSYIAHGALIENIKILAGEKGYDVNIKLFPEINNPNLTAEVILLASTTTKPEKLAPIITTRCTNRNKYSDKLLDPEIKEQLLNLASEMGFGKIIFIEEKVQKHSLATAASTAERIMLEYKPLHHAFFKLINWNQAEDNQKKSGMFIKTMGLKPPEEIIFKLFSYWPIDRFFSKLGLPGVIAKSNTKIYESSSAIAGIFINGESREDFINTGRMFQKIWLTATQLQLSIQPITGVLYLNDSLQNGNIPNMKQNLQQLIIKAVESIYQTFSPSTGKLVMLFRVGHSKEPKARSLKLPPKINFI